MNREDFRALIANFTQRIKGEALDERLAARLNDDFPAGSPTYEAMFEACRIGVAEGWMCEREAGGIRYGRVLKPGDDLNGFSVDVVEMADCAGPHHVHPNGEIDLVMPLDRTARFDGQAAGWTVNGPGSAHRPTVRGGRAYVLYLLPQGAIQFTGE